MNTKTNLRWIKGMQFDAEVNGHHLTLDAIPEVGGQDAGPRPKPLLLVALAGCTGMDVVSILNKMKVTDYELNIDVEGEATEEHPVIYHTIHIHYEFQGENLDAGKVKKAVQLSQDKYCGVSAMLSKSAKLIPVIHINGLEI